MQQKADEKMDPLTRIQEEIKEVVRREEEYRQLVSATALTASPPIAVNFALNGNASECEQQLEAGQDEVDQGVLVTAQPASVTSLLVPIEEQSPSNTPSLASSVNSNSSSHKEESLDEHHSDDSGISASSQKTINNNIKTEGKAGLKLNVAGRQESRYIGPNCYNMTPEPPQQKLLTRTPGTPQLQLQKRQFAFNGATKGVMQRFIASHGKLQLGQPAGQPMMANGNSPTLKLNSRNALAFLESGQTSPIGNNLTNNNNNSNAINGNNINGSNSNGNGNGIISISNNNNIERDSEGRPLRRGYVPVEQKIQRELQDLKSRETELKRLRKLNRQHLLEKLQCTDEEADADDDEDDSEEEHCYGPGKLRNAQSTLELEKDSNDLELMGHKSAGNRSLNAAAVLSNGGSSNGLSTSGSNSGMRPAMSLAQLCDLTPEEAPSSHRLIAQWESLIKKNAEGIEAAI